MKELPNKDINANPNTFITNPGTVTVDTTTFTISVHDGVTPGGIDQLTPAQNTFIQQISLAGTIPVTIPNSSNFTVTI